MTDGTASALGQVLRDRYVIERQLGSGGMASVYLARDLRHDRLVALKVLRPELAYALGPERFLREVRTAARLDHPHILPVFDSGEAAGLLWYTMPHVDGESLRDRLRRDGPLPLDEAIRLTWEVADALDYAHQRGVVHRDIKPENILLAGGHARVADFGVARALEAAGAGRLTETGLAVGTPAYMSPEQASGGQVDGRSDQYSLACVSYEMLAGEPPYTGPSAQAIIAKRFSEPVPHLGTVRSVPPGLESAVSRGLAKSPADRYQTASQFAKALGGGTGTETRELPVRRRPHRIWWSSAAALALLILTVGWWGLAKTKTAAATLKGVALLPCETTGLRPDEAYIGDRWSEELIQKLVRVGGLSPKSWASVRRYRNTQMPLRRIGAELNAGSLVRCQVAEQRMGVRLSAELIRAADERVLWSNDYERPVGADGINSAQSAAARDIAQELGVGAPLALTAVDRPLTRDSVALKLYRLGRHFLQSFDDSASVQKSIDYFERAVTRDSNFAFAYVGLAEAMIWRGDREYRLSRDYYPEVAQHLRRVIALDPLIAEAHTFLALYLLEYTHDWVGAEEEHRRALALNPSSADAHVWYGWHLQIQSRFGEAIREFERAMELDPTDALPRSQLVRALVFAGNETRALHELREALELTPDRESLYHHLAMMLLRRGQRDSAVAVLDRHVLTPEWHDGWLYAAAGNPKGQQILDSLMVVNASRPIDPLFIAALHAGLGNTEEAFKWLDRAYADRSGLLLFLLGPHPAFDNLRADPRFQELRKKAGFKH